MYVQSKKRALDKIYKRRDRYEIPDWQREEVWDTVKKQELIDSILRGWKLPKFYFLKTQDEPEEFEVVDGQQRMTAIFEFFDNVLPLSPASAKAFGGTYYKDLPSTRSDEFDDFEIDYDEITDATDQEIKLFFQRLQQGLPLTSSEKLNSVHSKLRNFCRTLAKHNFFKTKVSFSDKRYAYFDIAAKVAAIEIEGIDTGLRFDDLRALFESQSNFSDRSAVAQRLIGTFDYLDKVFPSKSVQLRNRSMVQSITTLAARIIRTGRSAGTEQYFYKFVKDFSAELSRQVELGLNATDTDYLLFQRSISANVKGNTRTRDEILLRKMLTHSPILLGVFDPTIVKESGLNAEIKRLGGSITDLIEKLNASHSAKTGKDLFKPTNKTLSALNKLGNTITDYPHYKSYIEGLYFVFWESIGERLGENIPQSFLDVNALRNDLQHDLDHGKQKAAAAKRKKVGSVFAKYSGAATPGTVTPEYFAVFQASLLNSIEADLRLLLITT